MAVPGSRALLYNYCCYRIVFVRGCYPNTTPILHKKKQQRKHSALPYDRQSRMTHKTINPHRKTSREVVALTCPHWGRKNPASSCVDSSSDAWGPEAQAYWLRRQERQCQCCRFFWFWGFRHCKWSAELLGMRAPSSRPVGVSFSAYFMESE